VTPTVPYRFAIALFAEDQTSLGTFAVEHDWEPVCEWTRLHYQRRGELPLDGDDGASVHPHWDASLGEPWCSGYRVEMARNGQPPLAFRFPNSHFRDVASMAASSLVESGRLTAGERYSYVLVAYPEPAAPPEPGGLRVTNASPRMPARPASIADYLRRSSPQGEVDPGDMPVFVAPQVLEDAARQTRACEGTETGSILIGSLWRDEQSHELFAEVTAQIPAEHTAGTNVKLTFTPKTWSAASAALQLRGRGEIPIGYMHSHPVRTWCKDKKCTPESQKSCRLARDFFSADDVTVMRAAFPRAYCVAMVANDTAFTDLTFSMFGNRQGLIQPRGFYLLEESSHGA